MSSELFKYLLLTSVFVFTHRLQLFLHFLSAHLGCLWHFPCACFLRQCHLGFKSTQRVSTADSFPGGKYVFNALVSDLYEIPYLG